MDGQIRYLANGVVDLIVVTQFTILKRPLIFYLGEEKRFERTSEFSHSGPRAKSVALGQSQVRCLANLILYVFTSEDSDLHCLHSQLMGNPSLAQAY